MGSKSELYENLGIKDQANQDRRAYLLAYCQDHRAYLLAHWPVYSLQPRPPSIPTGTLTHVLPPAKTVEHAYWHTDPYTPSSQDRRAHWPIYSLQPRLPSSLTHILPPAKTVELTDPYTPSSQDRRAHWPIYSLQPRPSSMPTGTLTQVGVLPPGLPQCKCTYL